MARTQQGVIDGTSRTSGRGRGVGRGAPTAAAALPAGESAELVGARLPQPTLQPPTRRTDSWCQRPLDGPIAGAVDAQPAGGERPSRHAQRRSSERSRQLAHRADVAHGTPGAPRRPDAGGHSATPPTRCRRCADGCGAGQQQGGRGQAASRQHPVPPRVDHHLRRLPRRHHRLQGDGVPVRCVDGRPRGYVYLLVTINQQNQMFDERIDYADRRAAPRQKRVDQRRRADEFDDGYWEPEPVRQPAARQRRAMAYPPETPQLVGDPPGSGQSGLISYGRGVAEPQARRDPCVIRTAAKPTGGTPPPARRRAGRPCATVAMPPVRFRCSGHGPNLRATTRTPADPSSPPRRRRHRYTCQPVGAVAQLVERDNRTVEARGSIPLSSTPVARCARSLGWSSLPVFSASGGRSGATEACLARVLHVRGQGGRSATSTLSRGSPVAGTTHRRRRWSRSPDRLARRSFRRTGRPG